MEATDLEDAGPPPSAHRMLDSGNEEHRRDEGQKGAKDT